MTTDPRILECAKAFAPDAWHENGRGGYTLVLAEEERARAIRRARACILKWLAQEPSQAMIKSGIMQAYDTSPADFHDLPEDAMVSMTLPTFRAMNAQAAKEITGAAD